MQNERLCGLYIDLLMTVQYSHEIWGWVVDVLFVEKTLQSNGNLRLSQNDNVLTLKSEFKLAPNPNPGPSRCGAGMVNQA